VAGLAINEAVGSIQQHNGVGCAFRSGCGKTRRSLAASAAVGLWRCPPHPRRRGHKRAFPS